MIVVSIPTEFKDPVISVGYLERNLLELKVYDLILGSEIVIEELATSYSFSDSTNECGTYDVTADYDSASFEPVYVIRTSCYRDYFYSITNILSEIESCTSEDRNTIWEYGYNYAYAVIPDVFVEGEDSSIRQYSESNSSCGYTRPYISLCYLFYVGSYCCVRAFIDYSHNESRSFTEIRSSSLTEETIVNYTYYQLGYDPETCNADEFIAETINVSSSHNESVWYVSGSKVKKNISRSLCYESIVSDYSLESEPPNCYSWFINFFSIGDRPSDKSECFDNYGEASYKLC